MSEPLIPAAGIYRNIPEAAYHGPVEICPGPSITSTGLKTIVNKSPAHYYAGSPLNPEPWPKTESKTLNMGKLAHAWILEGGDMNARFVVVPDDLHGSSKDYKAAKAEAEESGRPLLRQKDFDTVRAMADAMNASIAAPMFRGSEKEVTLAWTDKETGVWCRCRFDAIHLERPKRASTWIAPDYKTAESGHPNDFTRSIATYGYHMQAAFYLEGMAAVTGDCPDVWAFIAQEKTPPFTVSVCQFDRVALEWGRLLVRKGLRTFADCLAADQWPSYADNAAVIVGLPAWEEKKLQERHEAGEFTGGWAPINQADAALQ